MGRNLNRSGLKNGPSLWLVYFALGGIIPAVAASKSSIVCAQDTPVAESLIRQEIEQQENARPVLRISASMLYQPTAMPDRVILTINGDARTTRAVSWRTSTDVTRPLVEIAEALPNAYFTERAQQSEASSQLLETSLNRAHFHSYSFTDLKPGTKYAYRVGDGENWTEWFHFATAAAEDEEFSFIYFGDAQNNIRSMWSRVIREAYSDAPKAAFLLHAGDLVNKAESDADWGEWCGAGAWMNAMMPNLAVPGNHEQGRDQQQNGRLSIHWRPQFEFPTNGPVGLEETCYTLTYHNMRLLCLDSNREMEAQAKWLDQVLSENKSPWVVCCFHHPVFSTGKDRDNPKIRKLWKPIFDKYKVDLVLQGHDHTYGRTGLKVPTSATNAEVGDPESVLPENAEQKNVATGLQKIDPQTGTVYVVSVSGPKMYPNQRPEFMVRFAEDTQLYQIISIDGDQLKYEARTAVGDLYDAFELKKQAGTINQLTEIPPEVPENRRGQNTK